MNCSTFDIGCKLDVWFIQKWHIITTLFWSMLDIVAVTVIVCCIFLSMFGMSQPKKWINWTIAIYVLAKVIQIGGYM